MATPNATISSIVLANWPGVPANQRVERAYFGGNTIWSGNSNAPPTIINGGWSGSLADRQLANGATKTVQIEFRFTVQTGLVDLAVTFDDGCVVSGSRP